MKIRLYQISTDRDEKRVAFMSCDYAMKHGGVDLGDYDCVFDGDVDCNSLEDVFIYFNVNKPKGYEGRSMSVSDIVKVIESDTTESGYYYCDNIGFAKIKFTATETSWRVKKL